MKEIHLSNGHIALIDDEDEELCVQFKWREMTMRSSYVTYAIAAEKPFILMHRLLTGAIRGELVDHKNGNGLDNRRSNLRFCSKSQNAQNQLIPKTNSTGIKGVRWFPRTSKWHAYITLNQKQLHLGYFFDKELARQARESAEKRIFGEFSSLLCRP